MKRIREWYDNLAARERQLVLVFGGIVCLLFALLVPYLTSVALDARRDEVADLRAAINAVQNGRDKVADRAAKKQSLTARYGNKAPPLAGFLEKVARESKLEIPESQDLPDVPHGKKFNERSTTVRMRKVGMMGLARMLERIESSGYPISVSKLSIHKRGGETDSYDVELTVSAFDSSAATATTPTGDAKGSSSAETTPGKLSPAGSSDPRDKLHHPRGDVPEKLRPSPSGEPR